MINAEGVQLHPLSILYLKMQYFINKNVKNAIL